MQFVVIVTCVTVWFLCRWFSEKKLSEATMLDVQYSLCSVQTACCFIFINWEIEPQHRS